MVEYNPFSDAVMENPHPIYKQLREEAPVYHIVEYDAWALSRFDDIWNESEDKEHLSAAKGTTSSHVLTKVQPVTPMINLMDPPEHTELRAQVRQFFQPRAVSNLEPLMRGLAKGLINDVIERGECDVMADFASQLAVTVACVVNGFPQEDGPILNELVWRFFKREPGVDGMTEDGLAAAVELNQYFMDLLKGRRDRNDNADDVINTFRNAEVAGRRYADEEIASHLSMLIIGGAETFPKVFANCMVRLAQNPDQRAECVADPSLIPNAFQEVLRIDMPTQFLCRTVIKDFELRGQSLREGQPVLFLYPSGNRDEREFEKPDAFDIHRVSPRILSFGHGTHSCLGINVAKLEGRVCLEETLARIPDFEVDLDRAERLRTDFVQGYASLPIRFTPGAKSE